MQGPEPVNVILLNPPANPANGQAVDSSCIILLGPEHYGEAYRARRATWRVAPPTPVTVVFEKRRKEEEEEGVGGDREAKRQKTEESAAAT